MGKNNILEKIGQTIKQRRNYLKITQEQLGQSANLDRGYIGGIERGDRNLSVLILFKLCKSLEIKPSNLIDNINLEDIQNFL